MHRSWLPLGALLAATTLSSTAEAIAMVAIPWFVLELTGSYAQMGIVGFFTFVPRVTAIFFGGQVVDRIGFRTASILSDLLSGVSVCGIPVLYASGHLTFNWLIVLVVVGAFFDGPGTTSRDAMVPELAATARVDLDRLNAYFQGARRLSMFVGPVVAGLLVTFVGAANAFWGNGFVFAASASLTLLFVPSISPPSPPTVPNTDAPKAESFWSNTLFGFRFLRQHRLLLWLTMTVGLMNFLDAPLTTVQLPALVQEHYGSAEQLGFLLGAHGVGAVLGTILFSVVAPRLSRHRSFFTSFIFVGITFLILALAPPYLATIATMFAMGLTGSPLNPILMSIRQERVPAPIRARVFGTITAIAFTSIPLGQLIGGYLTEWLGVQMVIGGVAVIYLIVAVTCLLAPAFRRMDDRLITHHGTAAQGA